jgi:hypothetical protein
MKKIISLIAATSILLMGLVSCNIETSRSFQGDLTIVVTGLPAEVKALSMWGTPNEWKLANIEADSAIYIADVVNGKAEFKLGTYTYSGVLWCQFVPMTSRDMAMNDSTWWQTAFSGSSTYANAENNLVYDFAAKGAADPMKLTLDVSTVYGSTAGVFKNRFNTENFGEALKMQK